MTDQKLTESALHFTLEQIAQAELRIAHQAQVIVDLAHDGHDGTQAQEALDRLREDLARYHAELDRLRKALGGDGGVTPP